MTQAETEENEEALPGDVVYYASGPHVGIYLGNGKVVQCAGREYNTAANPGKGPTVSSVNYMPVTSIRRYLIVKTGDVDGGMYRKDLTPYSTEQMEVIWAVVAQEDNGSYEGALAVISSAMNRTESAAWCYEG
ncbi:MAG: C40 family peptidase, partial [Erysipelotrichaceae bacterium]|nr:C40 family peptidase [Erysipelotrichaceae bacterium]